MTLDLARNSQESKNRPGPTPTIDRNPRLEAALDYAKRGLPVIALHWIEGDGCSCKHKEKCGSPGKHPRWHRDDLPDGVHSATTVETIIHTWWKRWPMANVGIATGKISGVIVSDIDPRNGGDKSVKKLPGNFPYTVTARTSRKGDHYYTKYPDNGLEIPNDTDFAGYPGIDLKSDGGFVVAPPSHHISGEDYYWKIGLDTPIAPTPNWLLKLIKLESIKKAGNSGRAADSVGDVIPVRQRVKTLRSIAGTMRRRGMNEPAILAALEAMNKTQCEEPLPDSKIKDIAQSYGKYPAGEITGAAPAWQPDTTDEVEAEYIRIEREAIQGEGEVQELPPDWRGAKETQAPPKTSEDPFAPYRNLAYTVEQFQNLVFPPKKSIISPWLTEYQIIQVYGPRGGGKTAFIQGVLGAAAEGNGFGPWAAGEGPVKCCFVDGELPAQDIQVRIQQLGLPDNLIILNNAIIIEAGLKRMSLRNLEWTDGFKRFLVDQKIRLWAADNLSSLATGPENAVEDWAPVGEFFLDLRALGITTSFVHHAGKGGTQRGTSGREDHLDFSILIQPTSDALSTPGPKFTVTFDKNRLQFGEGKELLRKVELQLEKDPFDPNGKNLPWFWTYKFLGEEKMRKAKTIELIDRGLIRADIAKELGIDKSTVGRIVKKAIDDGLLDKDEKLTVDGKNYVLRTFSTDKATEED